MTKLKVPATAITKDSYDSLKILFLLQNWKNSFINTLILEKDCESLSFVSLTDQKEISVFRKSSNSSALLLRISKNLYQKGS